MDTPKTIYMLDMYIIVMFGLPGYGSQLAYIRSTLVEPILIRLHANCLTQPCSLYELLIFKLWNKIRFLTNTFL